MLFRSPEVSVLFEVEKDYEIVIKERFVLSKKQRLLSVPVTEADRGGFFVHVTFVYNGRLYTHVQEITVPWTNKEIEFEYMTFRDKLLPGQNEEWRLKLKDHTGGKITAELLASMYDASLDAFRPSHWSTNIFGKISRYQGWYNTALTGQTQLNYHRGYSTKYSYSYRHYDTFNWYYYPVSRPQAAPKAFTRSSSRSAGKQLANSYFNESDAYDSAIRSIGNISTKTVALEAERDKSGFVNFLPYEGASDGSADKSKSELSAVQPRTNFAETAFFYPKLLTDENGEVSIAFTVPESLTKWKFRALAVTKDLQIGSTEHSTLTQKPLMVMPNAPRFFREGDKITFQTKISALDDVDHAGACQLFLFDAITIDRKSSRLNSSHL